MAVQRTYKPLLDRLGLTYPQYLALHTLWESDGRTIGGIAERLGLESSTITPLVKRLEAAGFVCRARSADDERVVQVHLTAAGRALRKRCSCLAEALMMRSGYSQTQVATLNRSVKRLRDVLFAD